MVPAGDHCSYHLSVKHTLSSYPTHLCQYFTDCIGVLLPAYWPSPALPPGRLTPRSSLAGLAVDDIGTGTSSSSGRSESPATTEGRNRKYRRSDSERWVAHACTHHRGPCMVGGWAYSAWGLCCMSGFAAMRAVLMGHKQHETSSCFKGA